MAFSTSNVVVGRDGDTWCTRGQWTGNIGDAPGTIKVPGALLLDCAFNPNLASGGPSGPIAFSGTGTLPITVTVGPYNVNVTAGTFVIKSK